MDDFSAARNRALELATGQWILYIDADERIRNGAEYVRRRLLDPNYLAFQVLLTPKAGVTPYWVLRLWRNHPSIRFRGIVHENMWPALTEYQTAFGGKIRNVRLEIDHLGYEDNQSHKNDRYLPLLERSLKLDPQRVYCWCHMADIQMNLGNVDVAVDAWRTAMDIVRRRGERMQDDALPWTSLIQFEMSRDNDVTELLEEALHRFPGVLQLYWLQGRFLAGKQRFVEAIPCFQQLAQAGETGNFNRNFAYDLRLLGVFAYENLAMCHFRLGAWKDAVRYYDLALGCEPGRMDLRAKRAVASSKAAAEAAIAKPVP